MALGESALLKRFFIFCFVAFSGAWLVQKSFSQTQFLLKHESAAPPAKGIPQYDPEFFLSKREYLWVIKGREFANKNNYSKALELFEKAIHSNPKSTAYYWQGLAHERMASLMISDWYQLKKNKAAQTRALDESSIKNHYQQAVDSYQRAIEIFPDVDYLRYQLGKAAADYLNDLPKAEEHLLAAARLEPKQMVHRVALAGVYLALKRYAEARKECETALTDPRPVIQSEAHLVLGRIELEQKNFSKAIEELKLSLALNPGFYLSHAYLAEAYEGSQQFDHAIESYKDFLKLFLPSTLQETLLMEEAAKNLERLERVTAKSGPKGKMRR